MVSYYHCLNVMGLNRKGSVGRAFMTIITSITMFLITYFNDPKVDWVVSSQKHL